MRACVRACVRASGLFPTQPRGFIVPNKASLDQCSVQGKHLFPVDVTFVTKIRLQKFREHTFMSRSRFAMLLLLLRYVNKLTSTNSKAVVSRFDTSVSLEGKHRAQLTMVIKITATFPGSV